MPRRAASSGAARSNIAEPALRAVARNSHHAEQRFDDRIGFDPARIKAAWRRLARANHPDLTGDDPAASRVATRRMAEINDAYAALTREAAADRRVREGERADFDEARPIFDALGRTTSEVNALGTFA